MGVMLLTNRNVYSKEEKRKLKGSFKVNKGWLRQHQKPYHCHSVLILPAI